MFATIQILVALAGTVTDEDVDDSRKLMRAVLEEFSIPAASLQFVPCSKEILTTAWTLPSGRALAWKIAFESGDIVECTFGPVKELMLSIFKIDAMPDMTAEQEDIVLKGIDMVFDEFLKGKLSKTQIVTSSLLWSGNTLLASLDSARFSPAIRPSAAYILGFRYRKLNKLDQSLRFFETALKEAPEGSVVKKLAAAEMEAMRRKKASSP